MDPETVKFSFTDSLAFMESDIFPRLALRTSKNDPSKRFLCSVVPVTHSTSAKFLAKHKNGTITLNNGSLVRLAFTDITATSILDKNGTFRWVPFSFNGSKTVHKILATSIDLEAWSAPTDEPEEYPINELELVFDEGEYKQRRTHFIQYESDVDSDTEDRKLEERKQQHPKLADTQEKQPKAVEQLAPQTTTLPYVKGNPPSDNQTKTPTAQVKQELGEPLEPHDESQYMQKTDTADSNTSKKPPNRRGRRGGRGRGYRYRYRYRRSPSYDRSPSSERRERDDYRNRTRRNHDRPHHERRDSCDYNDRRPSRDYDNNHRKRSDKQTRGPPNARRTANHRPTPTEQTTVANLHLGTPATMTQQWLPQTLIEPPTANQWQMAQDPTHRPMAQPQQPPSFQPTSLTQQVPWNTAPLIQPTGQWPNGLTGWLNQNNPVITPLASAWNPNGYPTYQKQQQQQQHVVDLQHCRNNPPPNYPLLNNSGYNSRIRTVPYNGHQQPAQQPNSLTKPYTETGDNAPKVNPNGTEYIIIIQNKKDLLERLGFQNLIPDLIPASSSAQQKEDKPPPAGPVQKTTSEHDTGREESTPTHSDDCIIIKTETSP